MMSRLTAAERKALPNSAFGLPETRQYPMPDRSHAIDAKARAKQELERGLLSEADYERVCLSLRIRDGDGVAGNPDDKPCPRVFQEGSGGAERIARREWTGFRLLESRLHDLGETR